MNGRIRALWTGMRAELLGAFACLLLITLIAVAAWLFYRQHSEAEHGFNLQQAGNLALTLEIHARDTLTSVDDAVRRIKREVETKGGAVDLSRLMGESLDVSTYVTVASVADANGRLVSSTLPIPPGATIADLEHFQVHVEADTNGVFVGKPVKGRVSGKWSFHVTRRINRADGSFGGVAIIALDFSYWSRLLQEGDFRDAPQIVLLGGDGVARAVIGGEAPDGIPPQGNWRFLLSQLEAGHTRGVAESGAPASKRWVYRRVSGYPLVVAVGLDPQLLEQRFAAVRTGLATGVAAFSLLAVLLTLALLRIYAAQRAHADDRSRIAGVLRQSEERFRSAFDQAAIGMALRQVGRRDLPFQKVNQKFCDFLGYSEAELLSLPSTAINSADDEAYAAEMDGKLMRGEISTYTREKQYLRKDGSHVWGQLTVTVLHYPDGQPAQALSIVQDIDARRRAEAELQQSEARFRAIFEHAGVGITLRRADDRYSPWLAVNDRFCEMTGYRREELLAMSTGQLSEPGDNPAADQNSMRLARGDIRSYAREKRILRADGEWIWVEVTVSALPNSTGGPGRVIAAYQDISARKEAETRARKNEVQFKAIFDHAGVGISVRPAASRDLPYVAVNGRFCELVGYSADELLGMSTSDLTPPGEQDAAVRDNQRLLAGAVTSYGREKQLLCKGGGTRWVALSVALLPDAEGRPQLIMSTYQDIEALKVAETRLRESEGRLRAVIAAEPECVAIVSPAGELLDMNPAGLRMLEADSVEEMQRRRFLDLVAPQYRRAFVRLQYRIRKGRSGMLEFEALGMRGSRRWLEIHAAPLRDAGGSITALLGIARDVTDRRLAQEALAAERNLLRTVIDNLPDRIRVRDREMRIMLANETWRRVRAPGYSEVSGLRNEDLLPAGRPGLFGAEDREVLASGISSRPRELMDGPPEDPRWFVTTKLPLRDSSGEVIGVIGISRDITDFKLRSLEVEKLNSRLEARVAERTAQLTNANEELESFASAVSHDLRAPLRHIDGMAAALLEDFGDRLDESGQEYLTRIRGAARRMSALIEDLLRLSRVSRAELDITDLNLSEIAATIADELQRENSGRHVDFFYAPGLRVRGDAGLLRAALMNLLQNAWKFTSRQTRGRVEFGAMQRAGVMVYFVRDNGAGFDMTHVDRLFAAFQRLHSEREFAGTGIGLATVRRIMRRHGGEVWAEAEIDKGATFYFTLGSRPPQAAPVTAAPAMALLAAEPVPTTVAGQVCVLLVDDDPDVLTLSARALRAEGYELLTAGTGEAAVDILRARAVDIIVSDFSMPGMNGAQFLAQAAVLQPATLRLIVSGQTMNRAMQDGLRKGEIHHYFEKQHSYEPVRACIRDWVAARRAR